MLIPFFLFAKNFQLKIKLMVMLLSIFLHITLFYLLLALLIPVLRRYISSRTCAALWLLPNGLYLVTDNFTFVRAPRFTVYVPETFLSVLFWVWLCGMLAVLCWKTVGHFRFRSRILAQAWEIDDPDVIALWRDELARAGYGEQWFTLVRSPTVSTPLTIGFFAGTIRVVLPERSYTPDELRLILRHELIHIGREDAAAKLLFTFCIAVCWFNPLMWWAMRKSADDLELSCDETVLLDADEARRRQYAELLLRTAGDERGFTTCLSASAKSLRYRLHWVMQPGKRFTGSLIAGGLTAALLLTCGIVALAFERGTGEELIFNGHPHSEFALAGEAKWTAPDGFYALGVLDDAALGDYLAGLEAEKISDNYELFYNSTSEYLLVLDYLGPEGTVKVSLRDHVLAVSVPGSREEYFVPEKIDWTYLGSLLERPGPQV